MISFRDRGFCSAYCATTECPRRWTAELQADADRWWVAFRGGGDPPVTFSNFAPFCPVYRQPDPENEDHRELKPGETNEG